MERTKMKILYFGPIAERGKAAIGGYEAANRKNIDKLRELGIYVVEYRNPKIINGLGALGKLVYIELLLKPFVLLPYIGQKNVVMHITPLYRSLAWPSFLTVKVAQWFRIPRVVDLRAGSFIYYYNTKGRLYRWLMRRLVKSASAVTVEGTAYLREIPKHISTKKNIYYFPNVVDCSSLQYLNRDEKKINLFYFGRITKSKGSDIIFDVIEQLNDHYHLFLAGNIAADIDKTRLENNKITYLGVLTPAQLKEEQKRMHFFIFPTKHIGEGQSNSLIEAMANGIIPVVSDQGFNCEVVKDCGVVLSQSSTAKDYMDAIEDIVESGKMVELGKQCVAHIFKSHNLDIEVRKIIELYKKIICQ
ncbi:glycosyltransferase [Bacteroides ovatus]|nr:glycosyltransferase [Bacteroides ovatus]